MTNFSDFFESGNRKLNLGQYRDAVEDFDQAILLNPEYASAFYSRGFAKRQLGQYLEAVGDFDEAILLNSQYDSAFYSRGFAKANLGQYQEAIKDCDIAIELSESPHPWLNKGYIFLWRKHYKQATICFDRALELENISTYSLQGKGILAFLDGDIEEANKFFSKVDCVFDQYKQYATIPLLTGLYIRKAKTFLIFDKLELAEKAIAQSLTIKYDDPLSLQIQTEILEKINTGM